jgi:hypothetical protein
MEPIDMSIESVIDCFDEVWIDMSFQAGHVEYGRGFIVLSLPDWITLMYHIHGSDGEFPRTLFK